VRQTQTAKAAPAEHGGEGRRRRCGVGLDPYIRDEEILDSIKTHVLKKMAGIGRFR
jgi:hypothetical protein